MDEPAPKGITVVDKDKQETEAGIADNATKAGIPTTKEDVSPDPLHVLEGLKNMADTSVEVVGSSTPDFDKLFHGEGPQTNVKTTEGRSWLKSLKERTEGRLKIWK